MDEKERKVLLEIRKQEMESVLPNMQTIVQIGKDSYVVKSPSADEIAERGRR